MDRRSRIYVSSLGCRIVAFLILGCAGGPSCFGFELALPEVGTNINYDFFAETPVFEIADGLPAEDALRSQVSFADNKHLRMVAEAELHVVHVGLTLRAPGIASLFEPIFHPFDESMSLLRKDGSSLARAENSGVAYDDSGNYFTFGWDFHFTSDVSFKGFKWNITPSLIPGGQLPDTLTLETYMSAAGAIRVIPEPSCAALAVFFSISLTTISRSRHHASLTRGGADLPESNA